MNNRPNFVLIFPDQWRGDCIGYTGNHIVETPFIDRLASEGVTFTSAYSPSPTCIPARACMITGQTPASVGRFGNVEGVPWRYEKTLMKCLCDGGYQTLCAGKTHFYPQRVTLGFEEMRLETTQNFERDFKSDYHSWLEKASGGLIKDTANEISTTSMLAHEWTHPEYMHSVSWTSDAAIDLLERRDPTRPFFLHLGFHRPHPPLDPPERYYRIYQNKELPPVPIGDWADIYKKPLYGMNGPSHGYLPDHVLDRTRKAYYAQLTHIDYHVERFLRWLEKKGWLRNTYIIFSSDHGELLGDHYLYNKREPFEGSAKIPLIVKPPENCTCTRGSFCEQPVSLYDIMPTILEAAGIEIPDSVEGSSLMPLVRGEEVKWREFVHGENADEKYCWEFVTDGREKFAWETVMGLELFFDLVKDPQEKTDLSKNPDYSETVGKWRRRLVDILARRPEDGLSDGKSLISGKHLQMIRPELLERRQDPDGRIRPIPERDYSKYLNK